MTNKPLIAMSEEMLSLVSGQFYNEMSKAGYTAPYIKATARGVIREINDALARSPLPRIVDAGEPEPTPSPRRIENRVSALENSLFKLSEDHNTTLRQMIDLQRQVETNNQLYGLLKGRLDGIDEDHTELAGQVRQLTEAVKDADVRLMPDQNVMEKHVRAVDGLVQRLLERVQAMESYEAPYWEVVRELASQLGKVERDLALHRHGMGDDHFTNPPIQPYGEVYEYTPPQPAADAAKAGGE